MIKPSDESIKPYLKTDGTSIFPEKPFVHNQKGVSYCEQPQPKAHFAAMLTQLDGDVGHLLDLLRTLKIDDNTYVIFTSDNGPHAEGGADPVFFDSNGPFKGIKRDLYEGGIRVPCIVWGGKTKRGQVSAEPLANWDFLPTFADLAGIALPEKGDGISFSNLLKGKKQRQHHDYLYWEFYERGFDQAIRKGNWKALKQKRAGGQIELYDLSKDPGETQNLAASQTALVAEMADLFKNARTESALFAPK
jgi:arylsulfatase A-like enzyme